MSRIYSWTLVLLQLSVIGLLMLTGEVWASQLGLQLIQIGGVLLGGYAVWHMIKKSSFSALPEPDQRARLLTSGPYRYIRNPMYTSILLVFAPGVMSDFSWIRLSLLVIEILVLLLKIRVEEKYLRKQFTEYSTYSRSSFRLIPWLY